MINKTHGNTRYYLLTEKKPTVKYFQVFGSKCFLMKENHEKKGKFDTKAHESIFVGYRIERTTYMVFILEHKIIYKSVYVTFNETKLQGLHDDAQMELLRFENQGFLEDEEIVNDEPTFTDTVEDVEVVVNNLNGDAAQSQEVSTNHLTNGDSGNIDDRNESTSHSDDPTQLNKLEIF